MAETKRWLADTFGKLKKDKKAFFTVIIGIAGMLLVLLSELPLFSSASEKKTEESTSYYNRSIEADTEKLISKIKGVGKVNVMLTYDSSQETVWAKDSDGKTQKDQRAAVSAASAAFGSHIFISC